MSNSTQTSPAKRRQTQDARISKGTASRSSRTLQPLPDLEKLGDPNFDTKKYTDTLLEQESVGRLLQTLNKISDVAQELDSERQGLVYNHHHQLIGASETIKKIRNQAESLESSFEQLQSNFEAITKLTDSLQGPPTTTTTNLKYLEGNEEAQFDPLIHLPAILNIPTLLASEPRQTADLLWGKWEPTLRAWEEADIGGMKELMGRCREIMAEKRGERARRESINRDD